MKKLLVLTLLALSSASHADSTHTFEGHFSLTLDGEWRTQSRKPRAFDMESSAVQANLVFTAVREQDGRTQHITIVLSKSTQTNAAFRNKSVAEALADSRLSTLAGQYFAKDTTQTKILATSSIGVFKGKDAMVTDTYYQQTDGNYVSTSAYRFYRKKANYYLELKEIATHDRPDARAMIGAIKDFSLASQN